MKNILIIIAISLSLQGCIFAVGAAAGVAGAAVVYDHRRVEQTILDKKITAKIDLKIRADNELSENSHIDVACFNQIVLLTGQAASPNLRQKAEQLARSTPNVEKVYNQINVKGPTSSLTRASDAWITTKIRTELLTKKGLKSSSIKVITENGSVYLMGVVSQEQAAMAVDVTRQVEGVQRVVKIFQYTN